MKTLFPQANNMDLIYSLLNSFSPAGETNTTVAEKKGMHEREGAYYLKALEYLGFVEKRGQDYYLNDLGLSIYNEENEICKFARFMVLFFSNPTISDLYKKGLKFPEGDERKTFFIKYIQHNYGLRESTAERRTSTILSWFSWFENHVILPFNNRKN